MQLHTAAFAFMEMKAKHTTWVKMTLSIEDVLDTLQRRASSGGKRALKKCLRWKASP
jgi:hypothetical protein